MRINFVYRELRTTLMTKTKGTPDFSCRLPEKMLGLLDVSA